MSAERFRAELTHELSTLVTYAVAKATEFTNAPRHHSDKRREAAVPILRGDTKPNQGCSNNRRLFNAAHAQWVVETPSGSSTDALHI